MSEGSLGVNDGRRKEGSDIDGREGREGRRLEPRDPIEGSDPEKLESEGTPERPPNKPEEKPDDMSPPPIPAEEDPAIGSVPGIAMDPIPKDSAIN